VGTLDIDTLDFAQSQSVELDEAGVGLTILAHPDVTRIGEVAVLSSAMRRGSVRLSRTEPSFASAQMREPRPLLHPVISRQPLVLSMSSSSVRFQLGELRQRVTVTAATPPDSEGRFARSELERGILINLSGVVLLLLHSLSTKAASIPAEGNGLLGASSAIAALRAEIARVAELDTAVLIRGETGTGKELVARAIHLAGKRRAGPYVAVNMAAVPESTAASALFGHERGAFTNAVREHGGYFGAADEGTLFLDEIGETSKPVQALLLRALREGEIQRVGASDARRVNVRVLAATDAPLEELVKHGRFSEALLHRLEGYAIEVAPLRKRPDDIARLFVAFLRKDLEALGETHRFEPAPSDVRPWLPASFVASLLDYRWPGNVAELQSIARRVAIANRGASTFRVDKWVLQRLDGSESSGVASTRGAGVERSNTAARPSNAPLSKPSSVAAELSDAVIIDVMRRCRFVVREAAEQLGVSRSWLHTRLEFCQGLRQAKDLTREQIRAALERAQTSTRRAAELLEVSEHGLKLRMRALNVASDV